MGAVVSCVCILSVLIVTSMLRPSSFSWSPRLSISNMTYSPDVRYPGTFAPCKRVGRPRHSHHNQTQRRLFQSLLAPIIKIPPTNGSAKAQGALSGRGPAHDFVILLCQ